MSNAVPLRIRTIGEFHQLRELPKPAHPLISVIDYGSIRRSPADKSQSLVLDFYSIALKGNINGKIKYGQQEYDFDEGMMFFISPGQVFRAEVEVKEGLEPSGWILLIHPDFLWNTSLAKSIKKYEYFGYSVHEALFLSEKEEAVIDGLIGNLEQEYLANIDQFSQDIIISQLELLLKYADRFYHRQFITRKISNHRMLDRLEDLLLVYFQNENLKEKGIPSVQEISDRLEVSPNYLSGLLKVLTGQSTQQHIHDKLIEKAKEKLSTTDLPVTAIAYELGFEHSQSFSKLFKSKTKLSPQEFRRSFH
ncbi:helix-turn-helix domain-containing protein [Leptospira wolffii]|uniref:helix-turn-helix domain-containing protein n=1 Tax=Leptospira wolffii TaxID=409998 RepID=UPI00058B61FE|nr:helix-turn-helix transcriptional regulator [Leptospira wolffii]